MSVLTGSAVPSSSGMMESRDSQRPSAYRLSSRRAASSHPWFAVYRALMVPLCPMKNPRQSWAIFPLDSARSIWISA